MIATDGRVEIVCRRKCALFLHHVGDMVPTLEAVRSGDDLGAGHDDRSPKDRRQGRRRADAALQPRSEEHTSELQSLMRISYAVFCLQKTIYAPTEQTNSDQCA